MAVVDVTHFSDPGCPFAYSALPALTALRWRYGEQLRWRHAMIGLAEHGSQYEQRGYTPLGMARGAQRFRRHGMPFATTVKPHVAGTARACRIVVAVRHIRPDLEWAVFRSLQLVQFTSPLPLDSDAALRRALERVPDLDPDAVLAAAEDAVVVAAYQDDRAEARTAAGSPADRQGRTADTDGAVRYTAPTLVFERQGRRLEAGGFQPLEAYEVCLANLAALERRPAPEDPVALLEAFPHGLTTAEVAACLASPPEPPDVAAAEDALLELVAVGRAVADGVGDGVLWLAPDSAPPRAADERAARFARTAPIRIPSV